MKYILLSWIVSLWIISSCSPEIDKQPYCVGDGGAVGMSYNKLRELPEEKLDMLPKEPKNKVKYYPVLLQSQSGDLMVSGTKFKSQEDALKYHGYKYFLITNIPELIEERDE